MSMSSNVKPLVALGLTAVGTVMVANFQVSNPQAIAAAAPTDSTTSSSTASTGTTAPTAPAGASTTGDDSGTSGSTGTSGASGTNGSSSGADTSGTTAAKTSSSPYADGTYAGAAVREPWGTFKVQVTISAGELSTVTLVSSPSDRHSSWINSQAVPILTEEAVAAQSADIDMLSGATWTSQSYIASLQAALDDATAAQQNAG
jgi:uncharacterized protein with FMN-binding domain